MKKIIFVFLMVFLISYSNEYFFDGKMWLLNKTTNNTIYKKIDPYSENFLCKKYVLKNVTRIVNDNGFLFYVKKDNQETYSVCINLKNLLILIFLTFVVLLFIFVCSRWIYYKFKNKKEKLILISCFLNICAILISVFLCTFFYISVISFFVDISFLEVLIFVVVINLIYFVSLYLLNLGLKTKNALKGTIFNFILFVFPIELLIIFFNILLFFAEKQGIIVFILVFLIFELFLAEYYNKFVVILASKLRSKKLYKYEKEEEIKKKFSKYCKINNVYVIDLPNYNAFAVGLIKKDIYLTSKLVRDFDEKEVEAVIAHEVGHHYHNHLFKLFLLCVGSWLIIYFLPDNIKSILYIIYGLFIFFGIGVIQNRFEFEADEFAAKTVGPYYVIRSLEKLAQLNRIPKKTGKLYNIIFKHPSVEERIKNICKKFNIHLDHQLDT